MGHHLGLATRTQISVCKSPFPSAGTAVSLFRAKTVQQRPLLLRESKPGWLWLIGNRNYDSRLFCNSNTYVARTVLCVRKDACKSIDVVSIILFLSVVARNATDFESDFESNRFCHFFRNPNLTDLLTSFLTDSHLIFVLNVRKINCCLLIF